VCVCVFVRSVVCFVCVCVFFFVFGVCFVAFSLLFFPIWNCVSADAASLNERCYFFSCSQIRGSVSQGRGARSGS
jgi:hypothetical protein